MALTDEQRESYETCGFFYADDAVPKSMLPELVRASRDVNAKVRSGYVDIFTHRTDTGEPWAIRGLFAPEFKAPVFADYLGCDEILQYVHPFLGEELTLGSVHIFTNPHDRDWGFGWHRDFGRHPRDATEEVEMEILLRPQTSIKWHLALVDDDCTQIVPGSQKRYRTEYELDCMHETRHADIPGQKTLHLKAGRTVFWHGYTIHRGVMKKDVERLTLASSWSKHSESDEPAEVDKRLRWMLADNVRPNLPVRLHKEYDRWHALQIDSATP